MTKSPKALAQHALRSPYSSPPCRKNFTQHQLFAILALKTFFKADYRVIVQLLTDLREELKLAKIPHYSTLCYAANLLLKKGRPFCLLLRATTYATECGLIPEKLTVTVDGTSLESHHTSLSGPAVITLPGSGPNW